MLGGNLSNNIHANSDDILRNRAFIDTGSQPGDFVPKPKPAVVRAAAAMGKRNAKADSFWIGNACCNAACNTAYDNVLVYRIRMYFNSLSDSMQREFARQRMVLKRPEILDAPDFDVTGSRLYEIRIERPSILRKRLTDLNTTTNRFVLPEPGAGVTQHMCQKFFLYMIQRSRAWLNPHSQPTHKLFVPSGSRSLTDRTVNIQPGPRVYENRASGKTQRVLTWMKEQAELHLMMPNEDATILPYSTKYGAHAHFVLEAEVAGNFVDHLKSASMYEQRGVIADESLDDHRLNESLDNEAKHRCQEDEEEDEGQHAGRVLTEELDEAASEVQVHLDANGKSRFSRKTLYRYGNPLLGLRAELLECPHSDIASYSWFRKQWRQHPDPRKPGHPEAPVLKLRAWMPFAKCTQCIQNRKKREGEKDIEVQKILIDEHRGHLRFVKRERLSYKLRQYESVCASNDYLSLIIDGADQSDHGIPHTCAKSHYTDQEWKLRMHLIGVIAHGHGAYVYTCPGNIAQGHNVTIQALFETLLQIKKEKSLIKLPVRQLCNSSISSNIIMNVEFESITIIATPRDRRRFFTYNWTIPPNKIRVDG